MVKRWFEMKWNDFVGKNLEYYEWLSKSSIPKGSIALESFQRRKVFKKANKIKDVLNQSDFRARTTSTVFAFFLISAEEDKFEILFGMT